MACSLPFSSSCAKKVAREIEVVEMYRINDHPTIGGTRTGGLAKYTLTCSNSF